MTIIVGSNYMYTDAQLNRHCFRRRGGRLKSARAHHIYIYTVTTAQWLKTHVAYLTSVERMCLFCFVGYFYFTGYGPYPGGGTLYSSLSITVPPNRLK